MDSRESIEGVHRPYLPSININVEKYDVLI